MSIADDLRTLIGEIDSHLAVLKKISDFYDEHSAKAGAREQSVENAIILSDIFVNFYTCIETVFFRISQYFENSLDGTKWHKDVLKKMTLSVPGIRERVISDDTYRNLEEILRFRHFKRYYFDFNYDWDRLELVRKKFLSTRISVREELTAFREYLYTLVAELEGQ
jgi:hypothetical protein